MNPENQIIKCPVCGRFKKHGIYIEVSKELENLMVSQSIHIIDVQCSECIQGKYKPTTLWNLDKIVSNLEESVFFNYKVIYALIGFLLLIDAIWVFIHFFGKN